MTARIDPLVVKTTLSFLIPPKGGGAFQTINANPDTGDHDRNWEMDERDVSIENLRGKEQNIHIDTHGFELVSETSKFWDDLAANPSLIHGNGVIGREVDDLPIETSYYSEGETIIRKATGASKVVIYDHTIRRHRPGVLDTPQTRQPLSQPHVDLTPTSALWRIYHHHTPPSLVPDALKHRYQVINLWRPIKYPAVDFPLAFCDWKSLDPATELVPITVLYPEHEGEIFGMKYGPKQKWSYFHRVTPQECVLIKIYDSKTGPDIAPYAPYTAFRDPQMPENTPFRESIELRALVFYDE